MITDAITAFSRFGLGRRIDDQVPADPQAWLRAQLNSPDPTPVDGKPSTAESLAIFVQFAAERKEQFKAEAANQQGPKPGRANRLSQLIHTEIHDYLANAVTTPAPFRERLVWFWANHFFTAQRPEIATACVGAYIREAIRPNVTGQFSDMLLAVMHHPAMLAYLDQELSAGPNSLAGRFKHKGLNENLARESLELHTVSPASGYTQTDVTNYAKILTGWSISVREPPVGFRFRENMHEPGTQVVMGREWPPGEEGGIAILKWLGTHPATYHHLATKLVRHFVADDPPAASVQAIEGVLADTNGNLGAAADTLIDLPGAWKPLTKIRSPQDYVIASLRAIGADPEQMPNLAGLISTLGEAPFGAPFPIGWPDRAADWAGPEAMLQRVDMGYAIAGRVPLLDPMQVATSVLGDQLTAETSGQIQGAGSRREALALLFASPEFQRR